MKDVIKCIIVDDEPNAVEGLKMIIHEFCENLEVLATANSAIEAVKKINDFQPDLVFLDINMPGGSGFDFLEIYADKKFDVIFVTASNDYALKAFKVNAVDYLLKPIDIEELINAVEKVKENVLSRKNALPLEVDKLKQVLVPLASENNKYSISAEGVIRIVDKSNVIVLKGDGNYTTFHLRDHESQMMSKNLGYFASDFENYPFYRCHQSSIINIDEIVKITNVEGTYAHMSNGMEIKVSRNKKSGLLNILKEK